MIYRPANDIRGTGRKKKKRGKKKRKKKERGEKKGRRNWMINLPNSTPRSNKLHSSLYRVIFSRYALSAHSLHAWIGQFALLCVTFMRYLDASSFHFFFFYFFLVFFETTIKIGDRRVSFPLFGSIRSKMKLRGRELCNGRKYILLEWSVSRSNFYIEPFSLSKEKWCWKYKLYRYKLHVTSKLLYHIDTEWHKIYL